MTIRKLLLFAVALLMCVACVGGATPAIIERYSVTIVDSAHLVGLPANHWATYDNTLGNVSQASLYDDNPVLDPLDFCMPYWQLQNARFYINSNGFISPAPFAMCQYFCSGQLDGDYQFSKYYGGDWPLIGLWVVDLDPSSNVSPSTGIFKRTGAKTVLGSSVNFALVTYADVPPFSRTPTDPEYQLRAQIELWANGTIIMRYKNLAGSNNGYASMGLVWTEAQRTVPRWSNLSVPFVMRYDPVVSNCTSYGASCNTCIQQSWCSWCPGQCVPRSIVGDFCQASDVNACNVTLLSVSPQRFYNSSTWTAPSWTDIAQAPQSMNVPYKNFTYALPLGFDFPVFYNPPTWVVNNDTFTSTVYIDALQYVGLKSPQPLCGYCPTDVCWEVCSNAVLPFVSRNRFTNGTTATYVRTLPLRNSGDPFCTEFVCPPTVIVQTNKLSSSTGFVAAYTYQVVLFTNGTVQIRYNSSFEPSNVPGYNPLQQQQCGSNSVYSGFPSPTIGMVHGSASDASSALFPWSAVHDGMVLHFDPVPGCVDCNGRGNCNVTSRQCVCTAPFTGANCSVCTPDHYGPDCAPCPSCSNGGTCDDGIAGSGSCVCVAPYSGQFCELQCTGGHPTTCAPACNRYGGYCSCGSCVCIVGAGYYGATCSSWADPCTRYSLDQCPVCTQSNPQCRYCANSNQCITDPSLVVYAPANRSVCGVVYSADNQFCVESALTSTPEQGIAVIIVIIIFGGIAFCSCFVILLVCTCRKPNYNALVSGAVMGTPDFQFPRREREVVQMVLVKPSGKGGHPVQGIPLKQIPLKDLYALQQRQAGGSQVKQRAPPSAREQF